MVAAFVFLAGRMWSHNFMKPRDWQWMRQIQDVTRHRLVSHPAVTSLEPSIAIAIATTDIGAPGNSTTMPRIENHAAVPANAIADPKGPEALGRYWDKQHLASASQSQIISRNVACRTDGYLRLVAFMPPIDTRLPHAPPAGIGSALALVKLVAFPGAEGRLRPPKCKRSRGNDAHES